jgi:Anti-sigma factor NepR
VIQTGDQAMTIKRDKEDTMHSGHDDTKQPGEMNAKVQDAIGRALKAHYDDLVSAPVPDRFLVLLAELEAKEKRHD